MLRPFSDYSSQNVIFHVGQYHVRMFRTLLESIEIAIGVCATSLEKAYIHVEKVLAVSKIKTDFLK